jgi:hypothetical protein
LLFELVSFLEKNAHKKGLNNRLNSTSIEVDFSNEPPSKQLKFIFLDKKWQLYVYPLFVLIQENMIKRIKHKLIDLGYACEDFYKLEESYESNKSSRDLLIAVGWLISAYDIIELFISNSHCLVDEEYFKETALKV